MTSVSGEINDWQAGAKILLVYSRHIAFSPPPSFVSLTFQHLIYFPNWSHKNCLPWLQGRNVTSVECLKKRDRKKGPSYPDQTLLQYNTISCEIYFIEKVPVGPLPLPVLILIQQDCLQTHCLCLCWVRYLGTVTRSQGFEDRFNFYFVPNWCNFFQFIWFSQSAP